MAKPTWAELMRKDRRWVRELLRRELSYWRQHGRKMVGLPSVAPRCVAALRAALAELPEVPR